MTNVIILVGMVAFLEAGSFFASSSSIDPTRDDLKGITHIVGGFLAINITKTYSIIMGTFTGG